jgi:hypothetical protein
MPPSRFPDPDPAASSRELRAQEDGGRRAQASRIELCIRLRRRNRYRRPSAAGVPALIVHNPGMLMLVTPRILPQTPAHDRGCREQGVRMCCAPARSADAAILSGLFNLC